MDKHSDKPGHHLWWLGLMSALLPMLTIHLCWLVSSFQGQLSWCNPYGLNCHSVSATGRYGVAYFIFKGGMIPALVMLTFYWWVNQQWLNRLSLARGNKLMLCGTLASLALLIYTLSLGHAGDAFYLLRRAGVIIYLGLTFIAQLILGAALAKTTKAGKVLLTLSLFTLAVALCSLLLDALPSVDYQSMDDAFEWWLIMLLNLHGLGVVWLWKQHKLKLTLQC
ncbi:hypothetical protein [Lacimicrobium sp. SS2-24]|uniref:hypothetical protein n=1 Tax=Lacimicrobium sp. SS2-24 TaxID=2005569 RepID=UPI00113250ED|nr:hypothetical protein [Lacimicrobium sp. SS2-24]